jgi:diguanylate cyclase (GGDEF)-like protein
MLGATQYSRRDVTDHTQVLPDPLLGQVLDGRFEVTEFIAEGGMGRVYKATQWPLDRVVAVKLLSDVTDGLEEFRKRFFLEASLCARLTHPNIIRIFDYGCHGDATYYIAMEYLQGQTFKEIIQTGGPMQPRRVVALLKQVCAALIEAHASELVHRDLKPSNLFVTRNALGQEFVKILDFGVVKQLTVDQEYTQAGSTLGSPLYMSPEQIRDNEIDGRSDIYSLGVVLFQMLTGTLPFTGPDALQTVMKHLSESPPSFAEANPGVAVPAALEAVAQRALEKAPDNRFAGALAFMQALAACEVALPEATPDTAALQLGEWNPNALSYGELTDAPTGVMPAVQATLPVALEVDASQATSGEVQQLRDLDLRGYVAFIDLNCPYCFAIHERVTRWGLAEKLEWCMVEHASHVLDGPFDLHQEELLSTEVFEVHHRAPDVELLLPPQRCRSTTATRLIIHVQRRFPDRVHAFRQAVYRALWQAGQDIGDARVLTSLLQEHDMPAVLVAECDVEPPELTAWQDDWDSADFDHCIPVLAHPESGRVLIGLATERTITEFFLGDRARVVDSTVCYYQQQPSILVCGWMSHMWPLLTDVRGCCEILQAPTVERARAQLSERAVPDLLVIESRHVESAAMERLAKLARSRSVPWVVASCAPSPEEEVQVLSMGAVEYLPVTGEAEVARARLGRIMRDRYNVDRIRQQTRTDELTGLPTRRVLLEQLEAEWERAARTETPISLVLLDLDGFKPYNKTHGYLSGDRCLVQVAQALQRHVHRPGDQLGRFGGNEFAVLLPASTAGEAVAMGKQMCRHVAQLGIENNAIAGDGVLTASMGTATHRPGPEASRHDLVDSAVRDLRARRRS